MAKHSCKGIGDEFPDKLRDISFLVAGHNFGCGSSREQAVTSIKYSGVLGVIAKSFSRIFYRNAINQGFPVIECSEAVDHIQEKKDICVDFNKWVIRSEKREFPFNPFPSAILEIFKAGGLIEYTRKKISGK